MKLSSFVFLAAAAAVKAQEGCDCRPQIEAELIPVIQQRDALANDVQLLVQQRDQLVSEKDEIFQHRELVIAEVGTVTAAKDALAQELETLKSTSAGAEEEKSKLTKEIGDLKKKLDKQKTDMDALQKVAQENQKYSQEYKSRLASMRDKSAKLDLELEKANAKIKELESITIVDQIKKELSAGYDSILSLLGKHNDNEL